MIRYCMVLAVALASCLAISSDALGESTTTLQITILEPTSAITSSDTIRLHSQTSVDVYLGMNLDVWSSFVVDEFDIQWIISSTGVDGPSPFLPAPMQHSNELGPLSVGDYELTAIWTHTGGGLLPQAPRSGTGFASFSVVPEPSTCAFVLPIVFIIARFRRLR